MRIEVADVDYGSATATPIAAQSAIVRKLRWSNPLARSAVITVINGAGYNTLP
jgi:hypothetical protein